MKYTAPSQLFYPFNFCSILNKKLFFLFLIGTIFLSSNLAFAQLPVTYDFESGYQGWSSNGNDSGRYTSNTNWSCDGGYNIYSKDNDTSRNIMTSPAINLSSYSGISISFCHKNSGVDTNEGFQLQFYDGSSWITVKTYLRGTDFFSSGNGYSITFTETLLDTSYNFATNSSFRFIGTANSNNEWNMFDNVEITELSSCTEPTNQPTGLTFNSITETSMNIGFTPATSAPDSYLVLYNTTGTTPTPTDTGTYSVGNTYSGSTVLGNNSDTSFTLTGLTDNTTYYFYVFSFNSICSGGPDYLVTNPLTDNETTEEYCAPTTVNGTTTLACPSIDAGGVGLSGGDVTVDCYYDDTVLEASYLELGDTSSYNVESIPYNPPYQFGCLANPVSVNQDDVFSPVVNLPFDFCFYGNTYSSLVIGSNGIISFDTSLANTDSGWRLVFDIPNAENARDYNGGTNKYFFGPSIYGVHHDVDPSIGGEIGYQLITLDTGCQALVTAWKDVPMYDDNSILYSGMIVFYEDTNVIEIYIDEKNIDAYDTNPRNAWNGGTGAVGLQADATEATVPSGRNTTDWPWTASKEAWRFVPNGSSITTLKWYEGSISIANEIAGTENIEEITVNPLVTTTYITEVTYTLCDGSTIVESDATTVTVDGLKTWNGSQSTAWDNPNNWTPIGVPISDDCITIPITANDPIMTSTIDGDGYNLTVNNGAILTQGSNSTLTITDDISVDTGGTYDLEDSASLIQIDNVINNVDGTFTMDRTTNIRQNDYVYWSSPTATFNIEDVSSGTPNGFKYQWLPFVNRPVGIPGPLNYGEWESYNTGAMAIGKGYIIRGPDGHSSTPSLYTATFNGAPNNGDIIQPIERSTYTGADYSYQPYVGGDFLLVTSDDDNWNLIGNPYPSAINAVDFLTLPANSNIDGVVYLWTHGTDIGAGNSDPFYEDYTYNYNVADYIAYNSSGTSTPSGFSGNIGAGQGFFVLMNDSGSTSESVTFNNNMRSSAHANDQFYRNSSISNNENKNRIWLDYISPNGSTNTTLIAYVEGATNNPDRMFDAINSKGFGLNLYSLIDNKNYLIQGRQLPFEESDIVPIGINITESGIQTIAINTIEGLFNESENDIFIEDLETGIIHNLKNSPYIFSSEEGIINNRFLLKYNNSILGIDDFNTSTGIKVFEENEQIVVKSYYESIQSIEVFDLLGRTLFSNKSINLDSIILKTLKPAERVLFLKIILTDGKQKIAKIIF